MKKVLALITAMLLAMAMFVACGDTGTTEEPAEEPAAEEPAVEEEPAEEEPAEEPAGDAYKIFLVTMDQMDQHWVTVKNGAEKAVEEIGADKIDFKWLAPDQKDDAKQIEQINNAVADGADAILLAANGPTAVNAALEAAEADGVKIVYVDSPADFNAARTLKTDNAAAGKTAGEEMLKKLKEDGVTSGSIGIVNVNASTDSVVQREDGFRSAFDGTDFEILETQYGEGDAVKSKDIASAYIAQGVVGIFGTNEGSTVGTGNAIKEAGGGVVGVGFDQSDMILELIRDDSLLCAMAQNPDTMGYEGVKVAYGILTGDEAEDGAVVDTGVTVLNADNI